MKEHLINVDLATLAEGGLQEKFIREMEKVVENIMDPNTPAKKKRKITMTVTLEPTVDRGTVSIDTEVKTSLVADEAVHTTLLVGVDTMHRPVANELKSGTPGQMYIGDDGNLLTDTGQPVDELEKPKADTEPAAPKKVVDLRKGKEA